MLFSLGKGVSGGLQYVELTARALEPLLMPEHLAETLHMEVSWLCCWMRRWEHPSLCNGRQVA